MGPRDKEAGQKGPSKRTHVDPWLLDAVVAPASGNGTEQNALTPPLRAVAALNFRDAWFEFDSSFVLPEAEKTFTRLAELRAAHPSAPLALFGHADPTGPPEYNQALSRRRARAVYGVLARDTTVWEALYQNPLGSDDWRGTPVQSMLQKLGFDPGPLDGIHGRRTRAATAAFQASPPSPTPATGRLNPSTRDKLFKAYMDRLCCGPDKQPYKLGDKDFLGRGKERDHRIDLQGCSELNPALIFSDAEQHKLGQASEHTRRDLENAPNRRVTLHLFEPRTVVSPSRWPCPAENAGIASCKKRFWSDGEKRLKPGPTRRVQDDTYDTYGCRFFERITLTAPPFGEGAAIPRLRARWSKPEVVPVHNSNWVPNTPPTDAVPDECVVELLVDTVGVSDGTPASLQIMDAVTRTPVPDGAIQHLEVRDGKVVVPATNARPAWSPTASQLPWATWDKPFVYFVATVGNLSGESSRDYAIDPDQVLRIRWWYSLVSDGLADASGLTTTAEVAMLEGILGQKPSRKVDTTTFATKQVAKAQWGSVLRNSYAYHHASHGTLLCRTCGRVRLVQGGTGRGFYVGEPGSSEPPPDLCPGGHPPAVRSAIAIAKFDSFLGEPELKDQAAVPSVPRYLVYLNMCLAGWEPSLATAFMLRGTQHVVAFGMEIPDGEATVLARQFYRTWAQIYDCDPAKIPDVFFQVAPSFEKTMLPRLYGPRGGAAKAAAGGTSAAAVAHALGG
jgi:outer membrane protein OmpA-like peptidoglycan-associated protein